MQDSSASYDFVHHDSDPTPDTNTDEPNTHGTECAGEVGMAKNSVCGIGVAHRASIGGVSVFIALTIKASIYIYFVMNVGVLWHAI